MVNRPTSLTHLLHLGLISMIGLLCLRGFGHTTD